MTHARLERPLTLFGLSIEAFVRGTFGDDVWLATVAKAHVNPSWISACPYPDSVTYDLVITASGLLGVTPEQALCAYGEFFVSYVYKAGYERLLLCLGDSLPELLSNLNNLHLHLAMHIRNMAAPAFRCTDVTRTSCNLHYFSNRPGLWPIVKGVIMSCSRELFHHECTIELVASRDGEGAAKCDHEILHITYPEQQTVREPEDVRREAESTILSFPAALVYRLHPFHLLLDKDCNVLQRGAALARLYGGSTLVVGSPVSDTFELHHPRTRLAFETMVLETHSVFVFIAKEDELQVKGLLVPVDSPPGAPPGGCLLFLGSPWLKSLDDMQRHKLFMSDFSLHDMARDYLLLSEKHSADADVNIRLEAALNDLKVATDGLKAEQAKSQALLYQMLPRVVANRLLAGETVGAIEYSELTILFSDIVGFSTFCQRCSAREVCDVLNELYSKFDALCESPEFASAGVYKVETVGDAYMVVCNLEQPCDDHADVILALARALHAAAESVMALGEPLRIRVGVHTGPAVGSVVGSKKPQFCLIGDSVNQAARMESHGVPRLTHLTQATASRLRRPEEAGLHRRGAIEVKGLGRMTTYLALGTETAENEAALREALLRAEREGLRTPGGHARHTVGNVEMLVGTEAPEGAAVADV